MLNALLFRMEMEKNKTDTHIQYCAKVLSRPSCLSILLLRSQCCLWHSEIQLKKLEQMICVCNKLLVTSRLKIHLKLVLCYSFRRHGSSFLNELPVSCLKDSCQAHQTFLWNMVDYKDWKQVKKQSVSKGIKCTRVGWFVCSVSSKNWENWTIRGQKKWQA